MPNSHSSASLLRNSGLVIFFALLGGFVAWWLSFQMPLHESSILNTRVSQGGRATFQSSFLRGPANGRCEIVAPNGAVVASFVSIIGGSDNGWRARVNSNGFGQSPTFTVEAPENAQVGEGYRISTARYLWPQSSARFDVTAKNAPAISPFVPQMASKPMALVPLRQSGVRIRNNADLMIRNFGDEEYLGRELYGEEADEQTAQQVAVSGKTAVYLIRVQNKSIEEATFQINAEGVGTGWTTRYFDTPVGGREISREISRPNGWRTPLLTVGGHLVLRVEISRRDAASVAASTFLRVSNAGDLTLDAVRATASRQSIARLEFTVDGGKNWQTATEHGVSVSKSAMVGLRAIKRNPTLPWPNEPLKPEWHTAEATRVGAELWIQGDENEDAVVTAQCGNAIETKIHLAPER